MRRRFTAVLALAAVAAASQAWAQLDPTYLAQRTAEVYGTAAQVCLDGRAEALRARGQTDRRQLAQGAADVCRRGYVSNMVQRRVLSEREAEAALMMMAYRAADRVLGH